MANGIWEDEDARKFYEDLPDLRVLVPGVFLDSQATKKVNEESEMANTESSTTEEQQTEDVEEEDNDVDASELVDKALRYTYQKSHFFFLCDTDIIFWGVYGL